jgi:hypothetical protein
MGIDLKVNGDVLFQDTPPALSAENEETNCKIQLRKLATQPMSVKMPANYKLRGGGGLWIGRRAFLYVFCVLSKRKVKGKSKCIPLLNQLSTTPRRLTGE